jgi:hypothetical protein
MNDANGATVGVVVGAAIPYVGTPEITIARSDPSGVVLLKLDPNGFVSDVPVSAVYESSDCSGTPYTQSLSAGFFSEWVAGLVVPGPAMRAYFPSPVPPTTISLRSQALFDNGYTSLSCASAGGSTFNEPDKCCFGTGGVFTMSAVPLLEMDLSQLVPPFTIAKQ